jgi:hypothetical protein
LRKTHQLDESVDARFWFTSEELQLLMLMQLQPEVDECHTRAGADD